MERSKKLWLCLLLLVSCFFFSSCSTCFAEAQYRITEEELTKLESNLMELSELNKASQKELAQLRSSLKISENELSEAKTQTLQLESRLTELTRISTEQEESLRTANELLQESIAEEKRKTERVKRERNLLYGLLAFGVYMYCSK